MLGLGNEEIFDTPSIKVRVYLDGNNKSIISDSRDLFRSYRPVMVTMGIGRNKSDGGKWVLTTTQYKIEAGEIEITDEDIIIDVDAFVDIILILR